MKNSKSPVALAAAVACFLTACEPMDVVDPFDLFHDDDDDSSDTSSVSSQSASRSDSSLSGSWTGTSATGQVSTRMVLTDTDGRISGSLTWSGVDHRSVSGTRTGSSATLHIGGGDTWMLTISGNSMTGTGYKSGTTRTYALSFRR